MLSSNYDLIIIGASFAGLSAARAAAKRGLRVLVLEKKIALSHQIHTTGIFVAEAMQECPLPESLVRAINRVRLYAPSLRYVHLKHPTYQFYATDTPKLMNWLGSEAERDGVTIRRNTEFKRFETTPTGVVLPDLELSARFLIGADGVNSAVARQAGLSQNTRYLKGVEYEYEGVQGISDALHCILDPKLAPGYIAWALPSVGFTQIGLACHQGHKPDIKEVVKRFEHVFDFSQAKLVAKRGGLIPSGGVLKNIHQGPIMLMGDAAGVVSPLTGGGIHTALRYGKLTGNYVADYLKENKKHPALCITRELPRYRLKMLLRNIADLPLPSWPYEILIHSLSFRRFAERIFYQRQG